VKCQVRPIVDRRALPKCAKRQQCSHCAPHPIHPTARVCRAANRATTDRGLPDRARSGHRTFNIATVATWQSDRRTDKSEGHFRVGAAGPASKVSVKIDEFIGGNIRSRRGPCAVQAQRIAIQLDGHGLYLPCQNSLAPQALAQSPLTQRIVRCGVVQEQVLPAQYASLVLCDDFKCPLGSLAKGYSPAGRRI